MRGNETEEELIAMGLTAAEIEALKEDDGQPKDDAGDGKDDTAAVEATAAAQRKADEEAAARAAESPEETAAREKAAAETKAAADKVAADAAAAKQAADAEAARLAAEAKEKQRLADEEAAKSAPSVKLAELKTQRDELDQKFDDGDLSASEYRKELAKLDEERQKLQADEISTKVRADIEADNAKKAHDEEVKSWGTTVKAFLAGEDQAKFYTPNSLPLRALNEAVIDVQKDRIAKGLKSTTADVLTEAHNNVLNQFGIIKPAEKAKGKPRPEAPPTLANVPAAAGTEIEAANPKWAALDRLQTTKNPDNPDAYEQALQKLSRPELDAYLAAR